jgi:hypothetical protein
VHNSEIIRLIQIALNEDIRTGDVTAESIFPEIGAWSHGTFIAKQHGIACGLSVAGMVFQIISDNRISWVKHVQDGDIVEPGMILARSPQNMCMRSKEPEQEFWTQEKPSRAGENSTNMPLEWAVEIIIAWDYMIWR